MSDATKLLTALEAAGFSFRGETTRLIVTPASRLSKGQREAIAAHKSTLLALVYARQDRDEAMGDESQWQDPESFRSLWEDLRVWSNS